MMIKKKHDLQVVDKPLSILNPYPGNARLHTKKQLLKLRDTVSAIGWITPIIIDENNTILAGHGRVEAAKLAGWTHVPTMQIDDLSEAEKKAYVIADNRLGDESNFSREALKIQFSELAEMGCLDITGFDSFEIDGIMNIDDADKDNDNVHLPSDVMPIARLGDLWHIGDHRILCGDARDPAAYETLLDGQKANLVLSDPPYGVRIENFVSGLGKVKHSNFKMGAGEESLEEFGRNLLLPSFRLMAEHSVAGAIGYIFSDWRSAYVVDHAAMSVFPEKKNLAVWAKTNAGMGSFLRSAHELVHIYLLNKGKHINNIGLKRGRSNVWVYAGANVFRKGRLQDLADHATVKPRKLCADAIMDTSRRGDLVLDPFAGSGTSLAAAHTVGRRGYGIELDEKFVDVILRRLSELVGEEPLLDGKTPFSEVARERDAEREEDVA